MESERIPRIYQIKITVKGVRPAVWRRVLVAGDAPLAALHQVIQASLGWSDTCLYHFEVGTALYITPDPFDVEDCGPEFEDARIPTLSALFPEEGAASVYLYDYSDQWEHDVVIEKFGQRDPYLAYPTCVAGARARPPEDCGGPAAYQRLLKLRAQDAGKPAATSASLSLPADFDPDQCDLAVINRLLAARFA